MKLQLLTAGLFMLQTAPSPTATTTTVRSSTPTPAAPPLTSCPSQRKVPSRSVHQGALWLRVSSPFSFAFIGTKKPSNTTPKPKKTPAAKAKKPDKSIWDSDSDTGSKKSSATPKGTPPPRSKTTPAAGASSHVSSLLQVKDGEGRGRDLDLKMSTVQ